MTEVNVHNLIHDVLRDDLTINSDMIDAFVIRPPPLPICSYCGDQPETVIHSYITITSRDDSEKRTICPDCLIRALDLVFHHQLHGENNANSSRT